jgi:hypothetical protein
VSTLPSINFGCSRATHYPPIPSFTRPITRQRSSSVQPGPYGVWQGSVTTIAQDPEVKVPAVLQAHADWLGKVIASAQQQGVADKLPIFPPFHLDKCGWLANRYAEALPIRAELKLELLGELDPLQRLESVGRLVQEN